jgi:hypothetical protein
MLSMVRSGNIDQTIQYLYQLNYFFHILGIINKIVPIMPEFLTYVQKIISSPIDLMLNALDCFSAYSLISSFSIRLIWGLFQPILFFLTITLLIAFSILSRILYFEKIYK